VTATPRPIEELDALPATGFVEAVAPLFEGAPGFLERLAGDRPYGSWWNLLSQARVIAHAMPEPDRIQLLNAHPRLGAPPESVSPMSHDEQGYGQASQVAVRTGGTDEGDSTRAKLARLNAAYESWFGFRYCVFVAGRPLETLLPELEKAMAQSREHELRRGVDAVVDIAVARSGAAR
jgi:2-oxo-4-hydroxy-4-carboxy--5-ureidoimidazoline (OHCU) decarboxylase